MKVPNIWKYIPDRFYDPDRITGYMIENGIDPVIHHGSHRLAMLIMFIERIFSSRDRLVKLYLWRHKLWNSALVEGTGFFIYFNLTPLILERIIGMGLRTAWAITTFIVMPLSFFTKYCIYDRWLFKPNDPEEFARKLREEEYP